MLIDAANEADRLLDLVGDGGLATVVTTHQHADHWHALEEVVDGDRRPVGGPPADAERLPVPTDETVEDGDTIRGRRGARSRSSTWSGTPRARSRCSTDDPGGTAHLFTGDSLFPGGVGNTAQDTAELHAR